MCVCVCVCVYECVHMRFSRVGKVHARSEGVCVCVCACVCVCLMCF